VAYFGPPVCMQCEEIMERNDEGGWACPSCHSPYDITAKRLYHLFLMDDDVQTRMEENQDTRRMAQQLKDVEHEQEADTTRRE